MADDDLADRIRARRLELGLTQAQLAEQVGRAPSTIGSWETGRSTPADVEVLETLTHVLDLDAIEAKDADPTDPGDGADAPVDAGAAPEEPAPADPAAGPPAPGRFSLEDPPSDADSRIGEPIAPPATSDGGTEERPMQRTETTTVVVAKSRRVASRLAERLGRPAAVATVQPVRTDVDPMYRVRAVATVVVVVALGAVFLWAVAHLAEELGSILDAFLAPWR
jgi:transcriptional regulator with XRE-family HTH domain